MMKTCMQDCCQCQTQFVAIPFKKLLYTIYFIYCVIVKVSNFQKYLISNLCLQCRTYQCICVCVCVCVYVYIYIYIYIYQKGQRIPKSFNNKTSLINKA